MSIVNDKVLDDLAVRLDTWVERREETVLAMEMVAEEIKEIGKITSVFKLIGAVMGIISGIIGTICGLIIFIDINKALSSPVVTIGIIMAIVGIGGAIIVGITDVTRAFKLIKLFYEGKGKIGGEIREYEAVMESLFELSETLDKSSVEYEKLAVYANRWQEIVDIKNKAANKAEETVMASDQTALGSDLEDILEIATTAAVEIASDEIVKAYLHGVSKEDSESAAEKAGVEIAEVTIKETIKAKVPLHAIADHSKTEMDTVIGNEAPSLPMYATDAEIIPSKSRIETSPPLEMRAFMQGIPEEECEENSKEKFTGVVAEVTANTSARVAVGRAGVVSSKTSYCGGAFKSAEKATGKVTEKATTKTANKVVGGALGRTIWKSVAKGSAKTVSKAATKPIAKSAGKATAKLVAVTTAKGVGASLGKVIPFVSLGFVAWDIADTVDASKKLHKGSKEEHSIRNKTKEFREEAKIIVEDIFNAIDFSRQIELPSALVCANN